MPDTEPILAGFTTMLTYDLNDSDMVAKVRLGYSASTGWGIKGIEFATKTAVKLDNLGETLKAWVEVLRTAGVEEMLEALAARPLIAEEPQT